MFQRPLYRNLLRRLEEPRRFIQVLAGPRQTGKTTLIRQVLESISLPYHYASADAQFSAGQTWIEQQWELGRMQLRETKGEAILVLDEVQKIPGWSELVKKLWDEDTRRGHRLKIALLGSSPLLIQSGLTESLAGRFEIIRVSHWSYQEMHKAFGWDLNQYLYFGGYPGVGGLIEDESRWRSYILDSLVETTLAKDILLMTRVDKPALLRQLFHLACRYSGQVLSYQKMVGQLQDAGNTTTLAHYLELLTGAGLVTGLPKFSGSQVRQRGSSPKLQVLNNALFTAYSEANFKESLQNRDFWGRLVESAVGAHLWNGSRGTTVEIFYWREGKWEVDFVLKKGKKTVAIEVKSARQKGSLPGMENFSKKYHPFRKILVGTDGIPLEKFLSLDVEGYFGK